MTSILGTRVLRSEDPRFLTSGGDYIESVELPGALHVAYVHSTIAHARLDLVDVTDAKAMPGVVDVVTGSDVDLEPLGPPNARMPAAMARPLIARDTVRFVGEIVAAVVAETRAQAVDAAETVIVDYEPLPAVVRPEDARRDEHLLFPDAGTNVAFAMPSRAGDDFFAGCEVVVEQRIVNQRVAPCPLEVRAAAAQWDPNGRLTQWACTQGPHGTRNELAKVFGLERDQVRVDHTRRRRRLRRQARHVSRGAARAVVRTPARAAGAVGGDAFREHDHARARPGADAVRARSGGTRDGKLTAYQLLVLQDVGAYPGEAALLPYMTRMMACGVYDIPNVDVDVVDVVTNTTPTEAYRGAGRPEATAAIERIIELYATEVGLDSAELRRRNFISPDKFPFATPTRATYDSGEYASALDRVLEAAGYEQLRKDQAERRARNDSVQLGIGLSSYVEITGGGDGEYGSIEVRGDGSAVVRTGTSAHGQGHDTAFAMLASARTGIPFDRIEVRHGDTDDVPRGNGTGGSRSLQMGGPAIDGAVEALVAEARLLAADLLEANPDDITLDIASGRFHVAGTPAITRSWGELASTTPSALLAAGIRLSRAAGDVPVRRARRRRRSRHRDGSGALATTDRVRRCGHDPQPVARRRPSARRARARNRAGGVRSLRVRRRGQPAHRHVPRLRVPVGGGIARASSGFRWRRRRR